MVRQISFTLALALAVIALIATAPTTRRIPTLEKIIPTAKCQDSIKTDCTTARSVCLDIAAMNSAFCRAMGGINCVNESNRIYVDCVTGMSCPLNQ